MQYSIGEVAKRLNVSIHTLRYYEKEGLVPALKRDEKGNRIYTESEIQWVYMIRCLRDTDMPIHKIKEYIQLFEKGRDTIPQRQAMVAKYLTFVEEGMKRYQKTAILLNRKLEYYRDMTAALNGNQEPVSDRCGEYLDEWEEFKKSLEDMVNE